MWALQPPAPPAAVGMHARQPPCRTPVLARHCHRVHYIRTRCMTSPVPANQPPSARTMRKRLLQGAPPIVQWWDAASLHARSAPDKRVPLPCTVIVEGMADANAVSKAVVPQGGIIIMGGATHAGMPAFRSWLAQLAADPTRLPSPRLVLLLDGDHAGKQARHALANVLTDAAHAFLPLWDCRARRASTRHAVGNVGVEHASHTSVRTALQAALCKPWGPWFPAPWATEDLLRLLELSCVFNERDHALRVRCKNKRELVCAMLGIGPSTASSLLACLNRYGFTEAELLDAVDVAEEIMECPVETWQHLRASDIYSEQGTWAGKGQPGNNAQRAQPGNNAQRAQQRKMGGNGTAAAGKGAVGKVASKRRRRPASSSTPKALRAGGQP